MDERKMYLRGKRWWGDFRAFADVGGDREPLTPEGATYATTDEDEAEAIYDDRIRELKHLRAAKIKPGKKVRMRAFAPKFLKLKARLGDTTKSTMTRLEQALRVGLRCLRDADGNSIDPYLHEHTAADAGEVMAHIKEYVSPHTKKKLSSRSQRYALDALAEMFDWGAFQGHVPEGYNPYRAIPARVKIRNRSFAHLEAPEGAALLEALIDEEGGLTPPVIRHCVLAYTGARPEEGSSLLGRDILVRSRQVRIDGSKETGPAEDDDIRFVPLAPQLQLLVEAYQSLHPGRKPEQLLTFTHARKGRTGEEIPIRDSRKLLNSAIERAAKQLDTQGIAHRLRDKRIVPRSWRPTYCTIRLQTTEEGVPVAPHTVMAELGHQSLSMINKIYNRLGKTRPHRRPFVEYWCSDGRFPGEARVRKILGDDRVDAVLRQAEAQVAHGAGPDKPDLRLVK